MIFLKCVDCMKIHLQWKQSNTEYHVDTCNQPRMYLPFPCSVYSTKNAPLCFRSIVPCKIIGWKMQKLMFNHVSIGYKIVWIDHIDLLNVVCSFCVMVKLMRDWLPTLREGTILVHLWNACCSFGNGHCVSCGLHKFFLPLLRASIYIRVQCCHLPVTERYVLLWFYTPRIYNFCRRTHLNTAAHTHSSCDSCTHTRILWQTHALTHLVTAARFNLIL